MIPKDKWWGMSNLGLWGKNPCVATFVLFATFPCLIQPLQCLDFVSWGQLLHEETWAWENVGFGRMLSVLDGTHAQWRTFVSLTPVFILPMVGYSHDLLIFLRNRAAVVFLLTRRDSAWVYLMQGAKGNRGLLLGIFGCKSLFTLRDCV